jgi:polyphenol oxidase
MVGPKFITPEWPAPTHVHAVVTTRIGGTSTNPYDSLNLATHVGDELRAIVLNRTQLRTMLHLPVEPLWLKQVHGVTVINAADATGEPEADGSFATGPGAVCVVLTADCLPVLLCDRAGTRVAALHAGWRGLAGGVIEQGVRALSVPGRELLAWLGPAIGPDAFEVGEEVRATFVAQDPAAAAAFRASGGGKYFADIYRLARLRLAAMGVNAIYGSGFCTVRDAHRFYSYRRDGVTGRMASLIWLT